MIEKCLAEVRFGLDSVEDMKGSTHASQVVILPSEEELMIYGGSYMHAVPKDYPKTETEGIMKLRRINNPAKASYKGMKLRVGTTTLHIQTAETEKNIDAVLLAYTGREEETFDVQGTPISAVTAAEASSVLLLETGVISGVYLLCNGVALACSWSPAGKERFAGHSYPLDKADVAAAMIPGLVVSGAGFKVSSPSFLALPELVMLAVDSYKKASGGENSSKNRMQ